MRPLLALALLASCVVIGAQSPTGIPSFEVASVKPNRSDIATVPESFAATTSSFVATNMSLRNLITIAYRIQWTRIADAPSWVSDRFDIAAKIPSDASPSQVGAMLQALLAERFSWKAHLETRDQPIYALVMVGGKGLGSGVHR
jgi:uncharacterized protein (TIGR03435 family)